MDETLLKKVVNFHGENDWKSVLEMREAFDDAHACKILWAWPSEDNLRFLQTALRAHHARGVASLGCGRGLLEWILQQYTGLPVTGIEVNRPWWESKYCGPRFIPLSYAEDPDSIDLDPSYALLFCYFNNGPAFRDYIERYSGEIVIIIGPDEGSGRHTDPQPFSADFGRSRWRLAQSQQIKDTGDFIAVYLRSYIEI